MATGPRYRTAAALFWLALAGVLEGCRSCGPEPARQWAMCTCEYMTDMDQPGKISFDVCGESDQRKGIAASCARGMGVGAVLGCACRAAGGASCSDRDTCRDVGADH